MAHNQDDGVSRRKFLTYVVGGIGGIIGAALAVPLIGYFFGPAFQKTNPLLTPIGKTSDIPLGVPTRVTYEQRVREGWFITTLSKDAWVLTMDGQNYVAYDPRCTHLNCPYYWDDQKKEFLCPCHGGRFDINGNVLGGPPPRPLDRLGLEIQQGSIILTGTSTRKG
jgi:quinol---cytochrome c reductase iron-sulfur subunit, bacillus type